MPKPKKQATVGVKLTEPQMVKIAADLTNRRNESVSEIEREMIDEIVAKLDEARKRIAAGK